MSRIQEALAKAAKEKAQRAATETAPDLGDIVAEVRRPATVIATPVQPQVEVQEAKREIRQEGEVRQEVRSFTFEEVERRCTRPTWTLDPQINVFAPGAKGKMGAERFRTLRSRLYQIAATRTLKRVMVTSSLPSEGKSFVCANLAQSMVHHQNRRVLLIDGDLRKPSLHKILTAPKTPGLTNYLRGDVDEFAVIQKGLQSNLFFIPAGDEIATPSELLLSARMKKLMEFAAEAFDWVVLDSPPALPVHDPSMLANLCDGVLFVVRAASTDVEMAVKASSEFRQKNLLGVVFNHAEQGKSYGDTYYYG
jgi:protein-tyrosine kinase